MAHMLCENLYVKGIKQLPSAICLYD